MRQRYYRSRGSDTGSVTFVKYHAHLGLETEHVVRYRFTAGSPGTYWQPPDPDEWEFEPEDDWLELSEADEQYIIDKVTDE